MKLRYIISIAFICLPQRFASLSAGCFPVSPDSGITYFTLPGVDLTDIKNIPDLYFECQIAQMSEKLAVATFYSPLVREYIEIFLMSRKNQIPGLSLLSAKYFPLFETGLENSGLPDELKYIPVIESGLNPIARSPTGALGLWQFKVETGRSFGLVVNENTDERSDPAKSTRAACEYLKYLHGLFGNWQLTLLAYQAGPTAVRNAIKMAGGKTTFKAINPFLPLPTQRYLPSYIAMIYVLNNYKSHI